MPALSAAVVDHFKTRFSRIDSIELCIAPAQQAPRGTATLAAVLSYCGEPIRIWRDGKWTHDYGWLHPQWVKFARMKSRRASLCDIPDLELFPQRYPEARTAIFRAALEVGATQWIFAALATLRRLSLTPNLRGLASLLNRTATLFDRFGTPLGGMVVRVSGQSMTARNLRLAWHLTADNHHGPEIPCMAAIILARRIAKGELSAVGARTCMGLVSLEEFQPEFARWGMVTDLLAEP